jgi:ketosteroid isomerase-like protein
MTFRQTTIAALLCALAPFCQAADAPPAPVPADFASTGADRAAIDRLLQTYTRAVSTKDQALFETLLLSKDIPFSDVPSATRDHGAAGTRHYDAFRRGVFEGLPFTQAFQDVHVAQDGPLADVSLVFVNTAPDGRSWGWKTLQLLKVDGQWKIASEFYTGHR